MRTIELHIAARAVDLQRACCGSAAFAGAKFANLRGSEVHRKSTLRRHLIAKTKKLIGMMKKLIDWRLRKKRMNLNTSRIVQLAVYPNNL